MPQRNFWILLFVLLLYGFCSRFTLRDRILVESLHRIERDALVAPTGKQLYEGAMNGMTDILYKQSDEYSAFIPDADQKDYNDEMENRFDGIGVVYEQEPPKTEPEAGDDVSDSFVVVYPVLHSPAFQAGIRSGDKIVKVNGTQTKGLTFEKVSKLFTETSVGKVTLTILPFGKTEPREISVSRVPVQRDSVEGDWVDAAGSRIFFLQTQPDIAYIRLTSFTENSANEMNRALLHIAGKPETKGLILDLRGNPGGYVAQCVQIAQMFLQQESVKPEALFPARKDTDNVIVSTRYRNGNTRDTYSIASGEPLCKLPMVVLIDGGSASASEILSAALQDHHRAVIAGSRSFGKGCMQKVIPLPAHSGTLSLTDVTYCRPSGRSIHRHPDAKESDAWGVMPDPEGWTDISAEQRIAVRLIRDRRVNTVSESAQRILDSYVQRVPNDVKKIQRENKKDKGEADAFTLRGKPPYYDPLLDKAVEILEKNK